jgi:Flp pilus assembly protein TadD
MACLLYGSFLRRRGNFALAHWWLAQAWALKPGDWTVAAELAKADFADGDPARAENWLAQSVEANPKEPQAWLALASFYIGNDLQVEVSGIPAARQALLLAPDDPAALDLLGWGWYKLGDFAEAERLLRMAIAKDPQSASAHLHLGMTLIEEKRLEEAKVELQTTVSLDPSGEIGAQAEEALDRISL